MSAASGRTILIADDNPDQRALYVDILTHAGYAVIDEEGTVTFDANNTGAEAHELVITTAGATGYLAPGERLDVAAATTAYVATA